MTRHAAAVAVAFLLAGPALAVPPLANPDFEDGKLGDPPPGWSLREFSKAQGFTAALADVQPARGRRCLELARPPFMSLAFGQYGQVSQTIPANDLRGKRVRFRASIRTSGLSGLSWAGLFARVHRPDFRPGHVTELAAKPERATEWRERSVVVDVADDADRLEVGFVLLTEGTAWFDDASVEVLGPAGVGNDPPAPLTDRGRQNLEAFARLLAYVRYFHPSDEAAAAGWDRLAVEWVTFAEAARTPEELAGRLTELFAPLALTVQVFPTGKAPPAPKELEPPPAGLPVRVVGWRHVGVDPNGLRGYYKDERVADRALTDAPLMRVSPEPLPKPAEVYEADLGGGVSCRVPLAVYAHSLGTIPRATAKPRPAAKPGDFPPTGDDRATRLACVCLAWGLFQNFYPYFEEVKPDWPAALREALDAAATDRDAAAFNLTVRRLIARLEDSHGAVRPGSGAPRTDGALPLAWDVVEGKLVVTWVDPAAKVKLAVGDVVEEINGRPAAVLLKAADRLASGATPQHRRYRACLDLRNGPAGQPVELAVRPPKGEAHKLTVARRPADDAPLRGPSMREYRHERLSRPAPGVVYADLDRFTDTDFPKALAEVLKADGAVFDIRGYPMVNMRFLRVFMDKPWIEDRYSDVITTRPDRLGVALDGYKPPVVPPLVPRAKPKVAFLTDGRAVSYAETFLAVVDNTKIGPIVGEPTAGSNGGVALYVLPDGTRVSWTGQKAVRADGSQLHGVGIKPTHPVARTLKALAEDRDEPLEKAVELVKPAG